MHIAICDSRYIKHSYITNTLIILEGNMKGLKSRGATEA